MVFVTGDTHGDPNRLSKNGLKNLKAGDTLIVCGDFGFIWDKSKNEQKLSKNREERMKNARFDYIHKRVDLSGKTVVLIDDVVTTGASMSVYGYGSKENGDPITIKPAGSNIDIQWYNGQGVSGTSGKKTVEVNIYEDCYGVSLMLGFDGNPETVIYLDNFKRI